MSVATAKVPTQHASRYLQQLSKHWAHKYPVEFTPEHSRIELASTVCVMDADPEALTLRVETSPDQLERMQGVVAAHVNRFAFKEELQFNWVEASA